MVKKTMEMIRVIKNIAKKKFPSTEWTVEERGITPILCVVSAKVFAGGFPEWPINVVVGGMGSLRLLSSTLKRVIVGQANRVVNGSRWDKGVLVSGCLPREGYISQEGGRLDILGRSHESFMCVTA